MFPKFIEKLCKFTYTKPGTCVCGGYEYVHVGDSLCSYMYVKSVIACLYVYV